MTVEYIAVLWVPSLIFGENKMAGIHGFKFTIYAQTSTMRFCSAMLNFDKYHFILCLLAGFATKHAKAQLSLTMHWNTELDFGLWYFKFNYQNQIHVSDKNFMEKSLWISIIV